MNETVLAIDFGTKRIGLAVSRGSLAEPLGILERSDNVIEEIKKVCDVEQISMILVGISEGDMAARSLAFGQQLAATLNLPVHYTDETLSSHQVHQQQKQLGKSSPHRTHIDHFAAATFLQEWLDLQ